MAILMGRFPGAIYGKQFSRGPYSETAPVWAGVHFRRKGVVGRQFRLPVCGAELRGLSRRDAGFPVPIGGSVPSWAKCSEAFYALSFRGLFCSSRRFFKWAAVVDLAIFGQKWAKKVGSVGPGKTRHWRSLFRSRGRRVMASSFLGGLG